MNILYVIPFALNDDQNKPTVSMYNDQLIAYPFCKRYMLPPGSANAFSFRQGKHYMATQKLFGMKSFNNDTWDADDETNINYADSLFKTDAWRFYFIVKKASDGQVPMTGSISLICDIIQYYEFRGRMQSVNVTA